MRRKIKRLSAPPLLERLESRTVLATLVALVDTGVDLNRAADRPYYDLADAYNAYSQQSAASSGPGIVADNNGHGSVLTDNVVRGILDAEGQPGASGVAVSILPIRDTDNAGRIDSDSLIRGILYAADKGAAVINLSVGYPDYEASLTYAPYTSLSQAIAYAKSRNAVVVTAAGNNGYNDGALNHGVNIDDPSNPYPIYPAYIHADNMIVAAAADASGNLYGDSNYGPVHVDLGAPGDPTSFAAGYTSGVTGVVAGLRPTWSATQVVAYVKQSVMPAAGLAGKTTTGGELDAARAVGGITTAAASGGSVSIDCGGPASGSFLADTGASGGNTATFSQPIDTSGVNNPAPVAVYQSERWAGDQFTYTIPGLTPGGSYGVRLHFAENYFNGPGQRVFNVAINGVAVLNNFDIYAQVGGMYKALAEQLAAHADAGGRITIAFTNVVGGAKCGGIEIVPDRGTPVDLGPYFNQVGVVTDGTASGNLDGFGDAFPAGPLGVSIPFGGAALNLGAPGTPDVVAAASQTLALTPGHYDAVRLLGAATNGDQVGVLTINYADGSSTTAVQRFDDWYYGATAPGETVAATVPYRNTGTGRDGAHGAFYLYGYELPVDRSRTVVGLTLPNNANIKILAVDLIS